MFKNKILKNIKIKQNIKTKTIKPLKTDILTLITKEIHNEV